ncbi:hypothetical protein [Mucilaginibacter agri]|uniref:Uncharacterized protein n=1 Tax=Mucilaginibacter agri TaxID=2695265 RepID=A0A965ZEC5_9SPHI|nr:hypothetical protein [Mucilaginibacter agri]NCD68668.1 hypothetical protein [Mucilaginibacter agri]
MVIYKMLKYRSMRECQLGSEFILMEVSGWLNIVSAKAANRNAQYLLAALKQYIT